MLLVKWTADFLLMRRLMRLRDLFPDGLGHEMDRLFKCGSSGTPDMVVMVDRPVMRSRCDTIHDLPSDTRAHTHGPRPGILALLRPEPPRLVDVGLGCASPTRTVGAPNLLGALDVSALGLSEVGGGPGVLGRRGGPLRGRGDGRVRDRNCDPIPISSRVDTLGATRPSSGECRPGG